MKIRLSALTALAIAAGGSAPFADSGDGLHRMTRSMFDSGSVVITAAPLLHDAGNERPGDFAGQPIQVTHNLAALQPGSGGNESIVQTWNSAPLGFYDGKLPVMVALVSVVPAAPGASSEMNGAVSSDPNETVVATVNNIDLRPTGVTPPIATRPANAEPGRLKLHWFGN